MAKKNFKNSARASVASAFMSGNNAQKDAQEQKQMIAQENGPNITHEVAQYKAQEVESSIFLDTRRPIRTQGRKGKKKPRINMAFDPDIYEYIRSTACQEDKSLTQCVNDILYEHMKMHKK